MSFVVLAFLCRMPIAASAFAVVAMCIPEDLEGHFVAWNLSQLDPRKYWLAEKALCSVLLTASGISVEEPRSATAKAVFAWQQVRSLPKTMSIALQDQLLTCSAAWWLQSARHLDAEA